MIKTESYPINHTASVESPKMYYDDLYRQKETLDLLAKFKLEQSRTLEVSSGGIRRKTAFVDDIEYEEEAFSSWGISSQTFQDIQAEFQLELGRYQRTYEKAALSSGFAIALAPIIPISLPLRAYADGKYESVLHELIQAIKNIQAYLDTVYSSRSGARLVAGIDTKQYDSVYPADDYLDTPFQPYEQIIRIKLVLPNSQVVQ